jgi:hypothetical protein
MLGDVMTKGGRVYWNVLQRGVKGGKKAPAFRRGDELPPFCIFVYW